MKKETIEDLVLFGGEPAFHDPVLLGRPHRVDRDALVRRIDGVLSRRWFTNNGPLAQEFEARLKDILGVGHCVLVCNATIGLQIAIHALGLEGEVIVPSFTFIATANALQWQGVTPVFCDVDRRTHNLDPAAVEKLITPRTTGILGVHLWGRPSAVEALSEIATRNGLSLLFDAAHAFGCSHRGKMIGGFGKAEVFSFHATKLFHTFEGGAITTNDDALAATLRELRDHGFSGTDEIGSVGTNGKMTEVSAAMGLTGMESLDKVIEHKLENYHLYQSELGGVPGIELAVYDENEKCNFQYIVLTVDESALGLSRDQMLNVLEAENVVARRYFYPGCHRSKPFLSSFPDAGARLPVTELLARQVLVLPNGTELAAEDIEAICAVIRVAAGQGGKVAARLENRAGGIGSEGPAE